MCYKNGKEVIPPELLRQLQNYVQGELVYIPKKDERRAGWGESNGTRQCIARRNKEIFNMRQKGLSYKELTIKYHLSEDSIRKIIAKVNHIM